jgi:adenine-specific DNA-methyltransferase
MERLGAVYTPSDLALWVATESVSYARRRFDILSACDLACGDGELLNALKLVSPDIPTIGIDVDELALESAKMRRQSFTRLVSADAIFPPRYCSAQAHWQTMLDGQQPNLYLLNPPWGIDFRRKRKQLQRLGYTLASGQFDSFEIFCEAVIRFAQVGAIVAFILPDSIFYPEKRKFRELLLNECGLLTIARLGEGFFEGVYRATAIIIGQKGAPQNHNDVRCLRLTPSDRAHIFSKKSSLAAIAKKRTHIVKQRRFTEDAEARFNLDLRQSEESTINRFRIFEPVWCDWLKSARGIELSKSGKVAICPKCKHANPFPRNSLLTTCNFCSLGFTADEQNRRIIIAPASSARRNVSPIIVGEDVTRYSARPSRVIFNDVAGIDYKVHLHRRTPRMLVRKTGVGLKAAIDESGSYSNQVVFAYYRDDDTTPDFFLYYVLGVLCSRITLGYFLKTHGETEWKSHPYVTQKIINSIPIPVFTQGSQMEKQARAIADAARYFGSSAKKDFGEDVFIDCLVAGLYKLSTKDCRWVGDVLNEAQALEPIRTLRLPCYELLRPHIVL